MRLQYATETICVVGVFIYASFVCNVLNLIRAFKGISLLAALLRAAGHGSVHLIVGLIRNGNVVLTQGRLNFSDKHICLLLQHMVVAELADSIKKISVLLCFNFVQDSKVLR